MDKIFSYGNAKSKDLAVFRAVSGGHAALLRAICSNPINGHVEDRGNCIIVARHAAHNIARHCIHLGWSLGV